MSSVDLAVRQQETEELPKHNWEALRALEQLRDDKALQSALIGGISAVSGVFNGVGFAGVFLAYKPLVLATKLSRITKVMRMLLEEYESQGIQIFPSLLVEGHEPIDLFIRFPGRAHIIVSIRSMGTSEIVYNESNENLYVKRKGKGMKQWKPCPLVELGDYNSWFTKNRQIFQLSSKEAKNTPLAKVLVLWNPTQIDEHNDHLYSTITSIKLLAIRRKGTAFIIQQEEIANFVKAYLEKYQG